jgi:glycosyltransferase involved in cell wall biosynthesis
MNGSNSTNIPKVSVVIPAFNESTYIESVLETIKIQLQGKLEYEIIVVDDGSTDGTYIFAEDSGAKVIRHKKNKGYREAVRTGFANSSFPIIVVFNCDPLECELIGIMEAIKIISEDTADVAINSFDNYSTATTMFFEWILRILFGLKVNNPFSFFFSIKKLVADRLESYPIATYSSIDLFVRANKAGYRVKNFGLHTDRRNINKIIRLRSSIWFLKEFVRILKLRGRL